MPTHAEHRYLPYGQKELFELVAAVERYPEFLPWCTAARITRRSGNVFDADLIVRFKVFQERFVSKVTLHPPALIDVAYVNGPFRYLNNHWRFIEAEDGGCTIDFCVDFEFRSKVLQKLIGLLFNEAVSRMVAAFETRARQLYGERAQPPVSEAEPVRPAASSA
jgi:coenzyme Q-binding protein COQ10